VTAGDPVDLAQVGVDEQLIEHLRNGGTPDPDDHVARLLAALRAEAHEPARQDLARRALEAWARHPHDPRT
jgi:hypothetical protein